MADPLSFVYLPLAVGLGALHALEPGHSKTLIAAYLIGVKGTRRDALLLGLSAAATHSIVVIALAVAALWLGREALADDAGRWLQLGSGALVVVIGSWLLTRRWLRRRRHHGHDHHEPHHHGHDHGHSHHPQVHDHAAPGRQAAVPFLHLDLPPRQEHPDDEAHARAHLADMPAYVQRGERPSPGQVIAFGAAGGLVPCPASISVMLLALSVGRTWFGLVAVLCFSIGLAVALVGVGLLVVAGFQRLTGQGRLAWFSANAPLISAWAIIASGMAAILLAH